jgi:hypothetical protein
MSGAQPSSTASTRSSAGVSGAPAPIPPAGYTVDAAPLSDLGTALVGRTLL